MLRDDCKTAKWIDMRYRLTDMNKIILKYCRLCFGLGSLEYVNL